MVQMILRGRNILCLPCESFNRSDPFLRVWQGEAQRSKFSELNSWLDLIRPPRGLVVERERTSSGDLRLSSFKR